MATYTWSIPSEEIISGQTYIKDTDNKLQNTMNDLQDYVNGEGDHIGQGLTYDLVDKTSAQTITGVKTFSNGLIGNVTGNITGSITGNSGTATKLATSRTISINGDATGSTAFDGTANVTITTDVPNIIPSGGIIMWSGSVATIPSGWYLCNGTNGTPNLVNRFIIGAGSSYGVGATGGSKDAIVVSHSHTGTTGGQSNGHTHNFTIGRNFSYTKNNTGVHYGDSGFINSNGGEEDTLGTGYNNQDHSHNFTTSTVGSSGTNANLPPYYALCFIMKA